MSISRVITVSDVHLLDLQMPDAICFRAFLQAQADKVDLLVLNGDVFDFLVGRQRYALEHYAGILELIESAARRTRVVYLQGNHDFHLEGVFSPQVRIADRWEETLAGRRYVWMHGDTLDPGPGYRVLRSVLNSRFVRLVTERFPPRLAWRLALAWSSTSRSQSPDTTEAMMLQRLPAVDRALDAGADVLITGHYHFAHHYRREDDKQWWGLGPWMQDCYYLETVDGDSRLLQATP